MTSPSSTTTVSLSTGAVATIRLPKGKDLERAALAVGGSSNPTSIMMGVLGQVTTIGEKSVIYEELQEMAMHDVVALLNGLLALGGNEIVPSQVSALNS